MTGVVKISGRYSYEKGLDRSGVRDKDELAQIDMGAPVRHPESDIQSWQIIITKETLSI